MKQALGARIARLAPDYKAEQICHPRSISHRQVGSIRVWTDKDPIERELLGAATMRIT